MAIRPVKRLIRATPTLEGAGVHLQRVFGFGDTSDFDPFLLLDDFRGDRPQDYRAGFPWHPHRGIETITYVLAGTVEHGDSMGNRGEISSGDIQWMTAGSGIIHQEMPRGDHNGHMYGFQLWANLPATQKMSAPRYQGVNAADIPVIASIDGAEIRVVCGRFENTSGPVQGVAADPSYFDIRVEPGKKTSFPVAPDHRVFVYVFEGKGLFSGTQALENRQLALFGDGDEITVEASSEGVRFLLVSGKPLREPVAWRGPIVMNTQAEIREAFQELENGNFLKRMSNR